MAKWRLNNHIIGKVYDLSQENMNAMIADIEQMKKALEFYANWRNWNWEEDRVGDDSKLTNIKNDFEKIQYVENDGDTYTNVFGGKLARYTLTKLNRY